MMRNLLFLIILFLFISPALGQNIQNISLRECVQHALGHNAHLQHAQLATQRDDIRYKQARLNRLPAVSANLGHGFYQGRSVDPITNQYTKETFGSGSQGLGASLELFSGFRLLHEIRAQASARNAGRLEFESAVNELKLDVVEAYVRVLTARDLLLQAQRQRELTAEQLRRATVMHEEGAFPPGDYVDIKGQLKRDEMNVANNQHAWYASRLRLARLMGIDESALGELEDLDIRSGRVIADNSELFATAAEQLPQIKALEHRIDEAKSQVRASKAAYYPSLNLHGGLSSNYSNQVPVSYFRQFNNNLGKSVSVSLHIPLFSRLQTHNQVQSMQLALRQAEATKRIQLQELNELTAQSVFNVKNALSNVRNLEEQVVHYAEFFRIAQVHFDAGASNSYLYLAAKTKMENANQELVLKKYELVFQQYVNDYYDGTLDL